MADTKISALTVATTPLAGTEVLPIVQSGVTKQVSVANLTAGRAVSADSLTLTGSPLPATSGGTGQSSYAVGDLLYASTTTALSKLADVATGNALISGGVGVAPSWGKIGLATHVSGTLGTTNGGTGLTSFTANGILYASSTSALATSANLKWDGSNLSANGGLIVNQSGGYAQFTPVGLGALTGAYGSNNTANLWLAGGVGNNTNQVGHYINSVMTGNGGGNGTASLQIGQLAWSGTAFTSGTAQVTLFSSGGVSIGNTTDPGATNLSVTGTIKAGGDFIVGTAGNGIAYPASGGGSALAPAFGAYGSAAQAIADATFTKITFDIEEFDTNSNFASSRFTPTVAGYYQLCGSVSINGTTNSRVISVYKNGAEFKRSVMMGGYSGLGSTTYPYSVIVYANGSTDYFEIWAYQDSGTSQNTNAGQANVFFTGCLLRHG